MKFSLYIVAVICTFLLIGVTSCQKGIESNGTTKTPVDSTITDTTQFIDFTLNGQRIFQISSVTADSNSKWTWYPLLSFWGFAFPDTVNYQYNSFKGGLRNNDSLSTPAFYFLKNNYGFNAAPYTAAVNWWTPLIRLTFVDSFFMPGNYGYSGAAFKDTTFTPGTFSNPVTRKMLPTGIQLTWIDNNGKIWQTSKGNADQTNSFFTITENTPQPFTFLPDYADYAQGTLITAGFQCNLYDDEGNVAHITNGKFRLMLDFTQDSY